MGMGEAIEHWEYSNFPNNDDVRVFCESLVKALEADLSQIYPILGDTRPTHGKMFEKVTPPGKHYLAGNYRGAAFPQLIDRDVGVPTVYGNMDMGAPCYTVHTLMDGFHKAIERALAIIQQQSPNWSPRQKIVVYAQFVGNCFVQFLGIHPYANGNGHISRLLVWCLFAIKSISCNFWNVPNRNHQPTNKMITDHRRGDPNPLLMCLINLISNENKDVVLH